MFLNDLLRRKDWPQVVKMLSFNDTWLFVNDDGTTDQSLVSDVLKGPVNVVEKFVNHPKNLYREDDVLAAFPHCKNNWWSLVAAAFLAKGNDEKVEILNSIQLTQPIFSALMTWPMLEDTVFKTSFATAYVIAHSVAKQQKRNSFRQQILSNRFFDFSIDNYNILAKNNTLVLKLTSFDLNETSFPYFAHQTFKDSGIDFQSLTAQVFVDFFRRSWALKYMLSQEFPLEQVHKLSNELWQVSFLPKVLFLQTWIRKVMKRLEGPVLKKAKMSGESVANVSEE